MYYAIEASFPEPAEVVGTVKGKVQPSNFRFSHRNTGRLPKTEHILEALHKIEEASFSSILGQKSDFSHRRIPVVSLVVNSPFCNSAPRDT
jgi:hypothetical protein